MSDFALRVIANTAGYTEAFRAIPGFTDKMAAQAGQNLVKQLSKAEADAAAAAKRAVASSVAVHEKAVEAEAAAAKKAADASAAAEIAAAQKAAKESEAVHAAAAKRLQLHMAQLRFSPEALNAGTKSASTNITNLVRQLNDVGVGLAGGTSPLTLLTQQGEQIAFAFTEAGGASGVFNTAMGALGVTSPAVASALGSVGISAGLALAAVVPLYIAYRVMTQESDAAAAAQAVLRGAIQETVGPLERASDSWLDVAVSLGKVTKEAAAAERAQNRVLASMDAATAGHQEKLNAALAKQDRWYQGLIDGATQAGAMGSVVGKTVDVFTDSSRELTAQANVERRAIATVQDAYVEEADAAIAAAKAEAESADAKKAAEAAARALKERLKELSDAYQRENEAAAANVATYQKSIAALWAHADAAKADAMGERAKLKLARQTADQEAEILADSARKATSNASALEEVDRALQADKLANRQKYLADVKTLEEKEAKEAAAAAKKLADAEKLAAKEQQALVQRGFNDAVSGIRVLEDVADQSMQAHLSTMAELQAAEEAGGEAMTGRKRRLLERQIAAERRSAMEAFTIHKALALSSAIVSGAEAVQNALASAPPPYNYIEAGITGLAAAVEIGTIAAEQPSFSRGSASTPSAANSDGYLAQLHPREAVVTSVGRESIGEENIRRANSGMHGATAVPHVIAENHWGHRIYNDFIGDNLRRGGPLDDRIQKNRGAYGQREDRY